MKVRELIATLQRLDPTADVIACCEDLPGVQGGDGLKLFEIDAVTTQEAERSRANDGRPLLKLGQSHKSTRVALMELTADF